MHGFSFSKAQVSIASRKSGAFKHFAEYVFRRYATKEFLDNLPNSVFTKFSPILDGLDTSDMSGYVIGAKNQFSLDQAFCSRPYYPKAISTTPPALSVRNFLTPLECLSAFNSISQCLSETFGFE